MTFDDGSVIKESIPPDDEPVLVRAPLGDRLVRAFLLAVCFAFLNMTALAFSYLRLGPIGGPPSGPAVAAAMAIGALVGVLVIWGSLYAYPLQMALYATRLRLGGKLIGRWVDYDRVEVIDVDEVKSKRLRVTFTVGATRPGITVHSREVDEVLPALQALCPQASSCDANGRIELAQDPEQRRASAVAVRYVMRRRAFWAASIAAASFAAFGPTLIATIAAGRVAAAIKCGIALIFGGGMAVHAFLAWRSGREVSATLSRMDEEGAAGECPIESTVESTVESAAIGPTDRAPVSAG